jgi:hypothetical protein
MGKLEGILRESRGNLPRKFNSLVVSRDDLEDSWLTARLWLASSL